jgi:Tfp pilus assembly protein FimT
MRFGVTLVEMMIVVGLIGLLCGVALPRAVPVLDAIQVRNAVSDVEATLAAAKQIAIARTVTTTVTLDPATATIVARAGRDTLAVRDLSAQHDVSLQASGVKLTYSPLGVATGVSNTTIIVRRGRSADTVYVSRLGRVRHT